MKRGGVFWTRAVIVARTVAVSNGGRSARMSRHGSNGVTLPRASSSISNIVLSVLHRRVLTHTPRASLGRSMGKLDASLHFRSEERSSIFLPTSTVKPTFFSPELEISYTSSHYILTDARREPAQRTQQEHGDGGRTVVIETATGAQRRRRSDSYRNGRRCSVGNDEDSNDNLADAGTHYRVTNEGFIQPRV